MADYLQAPSLRRLVELHLLEQLSLHNCALMLDLAHQCGAEVLRDSAVHWARRNLPALLEGWLLDELSDAALQHLTETHCAHVQGMAERVRCLDAAQFAPALGELEALAAAVDAIQVDREASVGSLLPLHPATATATTSAQSRRNKCTRWRNTSSSSSIEEDTSVTAAVRHLETLQVTQEDCELREQSPMSLPVSVPSRNHRGGGKKLSQRER